MTTVVDRDDTRLAVFLSYSRQDRAFVDTLVAALEARGLAPKIDTRDLPTLEDWRRELQSFIRESDAVIFVVSPASVMSPVCTWELEQAADLNKRLAPIVLKRVPDGDLPEVVARINLLSFEKPESFDAQADALAVALQTDLAWIKDHTRHGEQARLWHGARENYGDRLAEAQLLRGNVLADAERWLSRYPKTAPTPTELHREFLECSRKAAQARAERLIRVITGLAHKAIGEGRYGRAMRIALRELPRDSADTGALGWDNAAVRGLEAKLAGAAMLSSQLAEMHHEAKVYSAGFSTDGRRIASSSADGTARLWDGATGQNVALLKHEGIVWDARFSGDGSRLVSASLDGTVRVWAAASGAPILTLRGQECGFNKAVFSPDGRFIVALSDERTVWVWDASTGATLAVLEGHEKTIIALSVSPDSQLVATASVDTTAIVWQISGARIAVLNGHTEVVLSAEFSPDSRRVVTASNDATARIWDATTGQELHRLVGHSISVGWATFDRGGQRVLTASTDSTARLWDAVSGQESNVLRGHSGDVITARFSPDGRRIVTASGDRSARVWDATSGGEIFAFVGHADAVSDADFGPHGDVVVTASTDCSVRTWSLRSASVATLEGHGAEISCAAFSPDDSRVVTTSEDGTGIVWDLATQSAAGPADGSFGKSLGRRIQSGRPTCSELVGRRDGARLGRERRHRGLRARRARRQCVDRVLQQ